MNKIILASQSPRRKELLAAMGLEFEVIPSSFDEQLDDDRQPEEVAIELALGKALSVAADHQDCYVIGSDTIVTTEGKQLAKPADKAEAHEMLQLLSGKSHEVTTSVALVNKGSGAMLVCADTTKVHFKPYDEAAVRAYIETGDPLDKAGGYGIQSGAAGLIDYIEGNYDTVIGLPTQLLTDLLAKVDIAAQPVRLTSPVRQEPGRPSYCQQ